MTPSVEPAANQAEAGTVGDMTARMIDTWFPCAEVDVAVGKPEGSGLSEKALFTWFASRPIAQARAAVLCSLLPDTPENRQDVRSAVLASDPAALDRLRAVISEQYGDTPPVVLDVFSGRGIIPLEAARLGTSAVGTDLSPVATLAGRLLADYPLRDWSAEPPLPYAEPVQDSDGEGTNEDEPALGAHSAGTQGTLEGMAGVDVEPRLLGDMRRVLAEIGRRVRLEVTDFYPSNPDNGGRLPWAYLWAVTIPCDGCGRHFPLIGSMALRHPYNKTNDRGQSLKLTFAGDAWATRVIEGTPDEEPTFRSPTGRRGKSARCPFPQCGHSHSLDVVKAKGFAGQYADAMLAVVEPDPVTNRKLFRVPRADERQAAAKADPSTIPAIDGLPAVPDEPIPAGNKDNVRASGYGYETYGALMNSRQAYLFATTARIINDLFLELSDTVSKEYAQALVGYAAANMARQIRRATRGANLAARGNATGAGQNRCYVSDIYSSQSVIAHNYDYLEAGPAQGPATWSSVSDSQINAMKKVLGDTASAGRAGRFRRASAIALPFRDATVDALVTDPPYYDMIAYADSSDIFYVWFKRALRHAMPDLFGDGPAGEDGLQDKSDEIIVKGRGAKGAGDHRSSEERYERLLSKSFEEARRVLKDDGHLTVIFGHADPEAWKRLLAALRDAGFVVTSSWPSRTETGVTGVATISVTVSIGARVAPPGRPTGIAALVEAEVMDEVKQRCRGWDADGLALEDQLMASYGAALQVVGRYDRVITPDGAEVSLEQYMTLSRRAVRDAIALRLGEQPLETFDPFTRLAVFWHETYGRADVPKGEARFFAQSDSLRLEDLRGPILEETKAGFRLRHDVPERITRTSSAYEVVRAMAAAQPAGTEAVSAQLSASDRPATDPHVWALVDWLAAKLPSSDPVAVSLAAIKRNTGTIQKIAAGHAKQASEVQTVAMFEETP